MKARLAAVKNRLAAALGPTDAPAKPLRFAARRHRSCGRVSNA